MSVEFKVSPTLDDRELSELHHRAFGSTSITSTPWSVRLERHSVVWVTAEIASVLVGFVNVVGDGGVHAFVLDTVVLPAHQGQGIGSKLLEIATEESRSRGCEWLHVDFEPELAEFYLQKGGFQSTQAGLLRLR